MVINIKPSVLITTGNILSPVIVLLSTPLLAVVYGAESFGGYYFNLSVSGLLAVILSGGINHAITGAGGKRQAEFLSAEALLSIFILFLFFSVLIALSNHLFLSIELSRWWVIVFLSTMVSANQVAYSLVIRRGLYAAGVRGQLIRVLIMVALQLLGVNYILPGEFALTLAAAVAELILLLYYVRLNKNILRIILFRKKTIYLGLIRKKIKFLTYFMPSQLLGQGANFLPVLALTQIGASTLLGNYSVAVRCINSPVNAIGNTIRSMYWRWVTNGQGLKREAYLTTCKIYVCLQAAGLFLFGFAALLQFNINLSTHLGEWSDLPFLFSVVILWQISSLASAFVIELLKHGDIQKQVLISEALASSIKVFAASLFFFIEPLNALGMWCILAFIGNTLAAIKNINIAKRLYVK